MTKITNEWRFCVAPMMDGTDRHCRFLHRLLTKHARLYTEMIVAEAAIRGDRERLLGFSPVEHPVALQVGGSDPSSLAEAARIGEDFGYDEVNLNVGCPSDRVRSGAFGACLMKTPGLVAECVASMRDSVKIPVTVKCRIGVDDQSPDESLFALVDAVSAAGCEVFIVHARKAWLEGLSPKENREIPPLDYEIVRRLKRERPGLTVVLNGGIETLEAAAAHLEEFDGVMLGRAAYGEPALLAGADGMIFGVRAPSPEIDAVVREMSAYVKAQARDGVAPHHVTRHMLGLFHARPGAKSWRRMLSEQGAATPPDILDRALEAMAERAPAFV
ncbi:MAG: tRNA dihydrouridine(20/20a) synthase DusA [Parvularculaceae bacterium]|nr:tRNA dihydrouridine(20/20a) synthase DusA [Parvularculaceae bacterium]